jgi:hypothetical protein
LKSGAAPERACIHDARQLEVCDSLSQVAFPCDSGPLPRDCEP